MKHWKPDLDAAVPLAPAKARQDWARVQSYWQQEVRSRPLPRGAGLALALLAASCIVAAAGLYAVIGPRDVFAHEHAVDWAAVEAAARR